MSPFIKGPFNAFKEVEQMLKYRFHDKERERSNHASSMAALAQGTTRRCPLRHSRIAWVGPPHDAVRAYVCLDCNAAASEPEIRDRGRDFETASEELIVEILDLDLKRQSDMGNPKFFAGMGGAFDNLKQK